MSSSSHASSSSSSSKSSSSSSSSSKNNTFTLVVPDESNDIPLLCSFPQGVPLATTIGDVDNNEMNILLGDNGKKGKKRKRIVVAECNGMSYRGSDIGDEFPYNQDTCRYAIGIINENTKEIKVISADHAYIMRPQLIGLNAPAAPARHSLMTNAERRESLTEEFGSKKKKRALQAKLSNSILSENIAGAKSLEDAMSSSNNLGRITNSSMSSILEDDNEVDDGITGGEDALEKNRRLMLPHYNMEATTLADAYPIRDLVPNKELNSLRKFYDYLTTSNGNSNDDNENGNNNNQKIFTKYLQKQRAGEIVTTLALNLEVAYDQVLSSSSSSSSSSIDASAKKKKKSSSSLSSSSSSTNNNNQQELDKIKDNMCQVLLLHYTIKYYLEVSSKKFNEVFKDDLVKNIGGPTEVLIFLAERFGHYKKSKEAAAYTHMKADIERLLMYILVLGLSLNNFALNITTLAKDLKLQPDKLSKVGRELACIVKKSKFDDEDSFFMLELVVPLKFPIKRKPKAKR